MRYLEDKSFFFQSFAPGLKEETFTVVNFHGSEAISRLYEFEITLMSMKNDVNIEDMLNNPAVLYLRPGRKLPIHGVLSSFEQQGEMDGRAFYSAVLVPRLWQLTLFNVSEVYLQMTAPEMIEQVLGEGKLAGKDYELKLKNKYRKWSFVCQYQETHFNFISRWMEREGIYYYFEQGDREEKLIITDTRIAHVDNPKEKLVHYAPASGMETGAQSESSMSAFVCRQKPVPAKVVMQDFNHRNAPPIVSGEAPVSKKGRGELMIYGEHMKTNKEAADYAKIRAEEILCRQTVFHGEGTAAFLRPGWYFDIDRHFREDFNRKYLLTAIHHEGSQAALLAAGVQGRLGKGDEKPFYRNSFEAMADDLQFRPARETVKPRFHGTINAKVEGDANGLYAELDKFGRYKVKFPFDRSDRAGHRASRWIRMAQPFGGPNEGMHFPLRKGAEVLLTFADGDPDRPLIAAAVPSTEGPSIINDNNSSKNMIKTAGDNVMHFEDHRGRQRILFQTPTMGTWIRMGAPNDPKPAVTNSANITIKGDDPVYHEVGTAYTDAGATHSDSKITITTTQEDDAGNATTIGASSETGKKYYVKYTASNGDIAYREVMVYTPGDDVDETDAGIRYRSSGNMHTEAHNRYCDYIVGLPADNIPPDVQYLAKKFTDGTFNPTGMKRYDYGSEPNPVPAGKEVKFSDLIKYGELTINKGDGFETQEGNMYDFGGHWDYAFGNGYAEKFVAQAGIAINATHPKDRASPGGPMPTKIKANNVTDSAFTGAAPGAALGFVEMAAKSAESFGTQIAATATDFATKPGENFLSPDTLATAANSLDAGKTGIEKTLGGNKYEYNREVVTLGVDYKCQEEKHTYGGTTYEYTYDGSSEKLVSKEISKGGNKEEWKYDRASGVILSYESTNWLGAGGNILTMGFSMGNKIETKLEISGSESLKLALGAKLEIEFSFSASLKMGVGASIEINIWGNPAGKIELKNGQFEYHGPGSKIDKEEAVRAKLKDMMVDKALGVINVKSLKLEKEEVKLGKKSLVFNSDTFRFNS